MKLPGAYKNRDKRKRPVMEPWLQIHCPGCDWTVTLPFPAAERNFRRHLERAHDLPVVAETKDPR